MLGTGWSTRVEHYNYNYEHQGEASSSLKTSFSKNVLFFDELDSFGVFEGRVVIETGKDLCQSLSLGFGGVHSLHK